MPSRVFRHRIALGLILVAAGLLIAIGGSAIAAFALTGTARRPVGAIPSQLPASTRSVEFEALDGTRLSGRYIPSRTNGTAVILLHGYGASRTQMVARARLFSDQGHPILLYDARGQGLSEGNRISAGWFETSDLLGALRYMQGLGYHRFGCLGASQGGATILLAAGRLPSEVQWVIVESTYPTMRDALDRRFRLHLHIPGSIAGIFFLPVAAYRLDVSIDDIAPIRHIGNLKCPVFVLGGEKDRHTLEASTRALYAAAHDPKSLWIVPGAAHVDLYGFAKKEYADRISAFVVRAEARVEGESSGGR